MSSIYDQLGEACKRFGERVGMGIKEANNLMVTNGKKERGMMETMGKPDKDLDEAMKHICDVMRKRIDEAYKRGINDGSLDVKQRVEGAYQRGLEDGKKAFDLLDAERDSEYQRGLEAAWEAAKKLFSSMADSDIEKAFPIEWNNGGFKALMNLQPQEAIERLKAYEEKQKADDEINVGDEVDWKGDRFIVTRICQPLIDKLCDGLGEDGHPYLSIAINRLTKTGRHFDIQSILEAMRE